MNNIEEDLDRLLERMEIQVSTLKVLEEELKILADKVEVISELAAKLYD